MFQRNRANAHFFLMGRSFDAGQGFNAPLISQNHVQQKKKWAFALHDINMLAAGLDFLVTFSAGEAFPNSVGEAMACTTPCVKSYEKPYLEAMSG